MNRRDFVRAAGRAMVLAPLAGCAGRSGQDSSFSVWSWVHGNRDWVCPSREPVRAYLRGLVGDLAANPAVDGVHLDYVRHCDVILPRGLWDTYGLVQDVEHPEFDFCYCDVCREQFTALDGRDPLEIPDPTADEAWRRFRWDSVTGAVRELAEEVHGHAKSISAAVFPTPTIARTLVRQAWDEWPLDRFFPMLYHGFYLEDIPWIGDGVREGVAALGDRGGQPLVRGSTSRRSTLPGWRRRWRRPGRPVQRASRCSRWAGSATIIWRRCGGRRDSRAEPDPPDSGKRAVAKAGRCQRPGMYQAHQWPLAREFCHFARS